jgi:ubiquinone/menaquinone biosynthesis C-methylase UbiE
MSSDNHEQIEYWNGRAGETWVAAQEQLDAMLAPISDALVERAEVMSGERAVDVGCGCGDTTLALAARGATVWGIDISEPMLNRARARAPAGAKVAFARTDAATQAFTPDHELVFSRFGVMFFADPHGAFRNLRTALTEGGRVCFVCWQAPQLNPWMAIAGRAVQPLLPQPAG